MELGKLRETQDLPWPTLEELSAGAQKKRSEMGIVSDSLVLSFSEINSKSLWKEYNTTSGNPLIAPLTTLRMSGTSLQESLEWQGIYKELLEAFPEDVQSELIYQATIPLEQRDSIYTALDRVLWGISSGLSMLRAANQAPTKIQEAINEYNATLPAIKARITLEYVEEILRSVKEQLDVNGRINRDYEGLNQFVFEIQERSLAFQEAIKEKDYALMKEGFQAISDLNQKMAGRFIGDQNQNLKAALNLLEETAAALTLGTGKASIFNSLGLFTIEGHTQTTSLIGKPLLSLIDGFIQSTRGFFPEGYHATEKLLSRFLQVAVLAIFIAVETLDFNQLEIITRFLAKTGALDTLTALFAKTIGATKEESASSVFSMVAFLFVGMLASQKSKAQGELFYENLQNSLLTYIEKIQEEGIFSDGLHPQMAIFLEQLKTSLINHEFENSVLIVEEGYDAALDEIYYDNKAKEDWKEQIKEFREFFQRTLALIFERKEENIHYSV